MMKRDGHNRAGLQAWQCRKDVTRPLGNGYRNINMSSSIAIAGLFSDLFTESSYVPAT